LSNRIGEFEDLKQTEESLSGDCLKAWNRINSIKKELNEKEPLFENLRNAIEKGV
jgi:hypothetical protein